MENIIIKFFNMKKQFLNLGKALNKAEQKQINGGLHELKFDDGEPCSACTSNSGCNSGVCANFGGDCSHPCGCGKMCL